MSNKWSALHIWIIPPMFLSLKSLLRLFFSFLKHRVKVWVVCCGWKSQTLVQLMWWVRYGPPCDVLHAWYTRHLLNETMFLLLAKVRILPVTFLFYLARNRPKCKGLDKDTCLFDWRHLTLVQRNPPSLSTGVFSNSPCSTGCCD